MDRSVVLLIGLALGLGAGVWIGRTVLVPGPRERDDATAAATSAKRIEELEARVRELSSTPRPSGDLSVNTSVGRPAPSPARPQAPVDAAPAPVAGGTKTATIAVPGFESALAVVDWADVGKNLSAMPPALTKFVTQWAKDGKMPVELAGDVQSHNGPLLKAAGALSKALKIDNPNVAFTLPAFQANAIAAALEAAGLALDDGQRASIAKLVQSAVDDEASRAGRYDERTLEIRKLLDRAEVRDRFFDGVRAVLTAEQRAVLGPEEWRGRLQADLYSSGLIWATVAQSIPVTDRESCMSQFSAILGSQFGVPAAATADFSALVADWARDLPNEVFSGELDPRDAVGLVPVAMVTDFARRQAALEDRVLERIKLDDAGVRKIRAFGYVLFPLRARAKDATK